MMLLDMKRDVRRGLVEYRPSALRAILANFFFTSRSRRSAGTQHMLEEARLARAHLMGPDVDPAQPVAGAGFPD